MAWRRPGDKPLSEPMMVSLLTHICITRPQWVNSLWPTDAIRRQRSRSRLVQVVACCLTAPSHYLNQCWLIISGFLWHSPTAYFTQSAQDIILSNEFQNTCTLVKLLPHLRGQWVESFFTYWLYTEIFKIPYPNFFLLTGPDKKVTGPKPPGWRWCCVQQAITWTHDLLSIEPLWTFFSDLSQIIRNVEIFYKMSTLLFRPPCVNINSSPNAWK